MKTLTSNNLPQVEIIRIIKNFEFKVNELISLDDDKHNLNSLTWCSAKNIEKIKSIFNTTIIVPADITISYLENNTCNYILSKSPRLLFQRILVEFCSDKIEARISVSAHIADTVKIGKNVFIGDNVILEDDCEIGDNVYIDHNSVIKRKTIIGNDVKIGAGVVIGGVGFGYEKDEKGEYNLIPHLGNVILHNKVEIGNNTCIDRAVLGSTILYENVKVDNLVHIAHGVKIGQNSVIIANAMVAGSVNLGQNTWIAPSASILNKVNVGNNAVIGLGTVVLKNVADNVVIVGNPGHKLKNRK